MHGGFPEGKKIKVVLVDSWQKTKKSSDMS